MDKMTKQNIRFDILKCAHYLFLENGYEATTLSLIASTLGISRDLMDMFYTAKSEIVSDIFRIIHTYIDNLIQKNYDHNIDPLTYSAAEIESKINYLYNSDYHDLFMKCLKSDDYLVSLKSTSQKAMNVILEQQGITINDDYKQLYGILIPYEVEKNLFLGIESSQFTTIKIEEIITYIMHIRFERWIAYDVIDQAVEKAALFSKLIEGTTANRLTNTELSYYYQMTISK